MAVKITKAEFAGRVIDRVADHIHDAAGVLQDQVVPDTVHLKDIKDWNFSRAMRWFVENSMVVGKYSGAALIYATEYTTRVMNALMVNNPVLRGLENKFASTKITKPQKNSNWSKFRVGVQKVTKKYPAVTSYLAYYMFLGGVLLGGGYATNAAGMDKDNKSKKELVINKEKAQTKQTGYEYSQLAQEAGNALGVNAVDPQTEKYATKALEAYWPEIAVGLTELETYRATPKVHSGEKRATNGLGCTWMYTYDKQGVLKRKANIPGKTLTRTKDNNYEQCKRHLLYETLPQLQRVTKGKDNISARQAVALVYVGYQRSADMAEIAKRISVAKTVQDVADAFAYYPGAEKWREGTLKRRWICAAYAANVIDANDLLEMDCDAFSTVNINNVYRNGHFLLGQETVEYVLSRVRGKKESVKTFLSDFSEGKEILKAIKDIKQDVKKPVVKLSEQGKHIEKSMKTFNAADKAYKEKNYAKAVSLYEQAIQEDADNMEAYSSLALAYIRLGEKTNSVEYYNKCIQAVRKGNARMNANKSLLMDREIKASSYYNAALAYEKMAKIYSAKGDKETADKCNKSALSNYKTALKNAKMTDMDMARQRLYNKAIDRLQNKTETKQKSMPKVNKTKGKKVAFNSGMEKISSRSVLIYGQEYQGNSIA